MRFYMPMGAPASGLVNRTLTTNQGNYALTGQSATLTYTPASTGGTWPVDQNDARFASNTPISYPIDATGTTVTRRDFIDNGSGTEAIGYSDYTVSYCRFLGVREGPRISGPNVTIDNCYISVVGSGSDHADGIQGYYSLSGASTDSANINITNTKVVVSGATNCAVFFADRIGARVRIENCWFEGSVPNAILGLFNDVPSSNDIGVRSVYLNNVVINKLSSTGSTIGAASGPDPVNLGWTNVRTASGTPITYSDVFG